MVQKEEIMEFIDRFVKHRDIYIKKIKEIKKEDDKVKVIYNNKEENYYVLPKLKKIELEDKNNKFFVCLNNEENLKELIKNWEWYLKNEVTIIFLDPNTDKRWFVNVKSHESITERKNLEKGLKSLYESSFL